ncbi:MULTISPECIES: site-2 protease family protein [Kocuria]|uniref:Peptidase M50B family protein n=1 Tax=Kocuria subflava TaxID=1736139 RepID=A0A846TKS1_9MICC|nr:MULTISPECIES: site-2 protease family protein [Kocuria]NKE09808.1 peptidase M50B family protein [Kocuria subflava]
MPPVEAAGPARGKRKSLRLGRVGGFPLLLDRSWFVIAAVIILLYSPVLGRVLPNIGGWSYAVAAAFCLLLALSVLLHEWAHAWTARAFGWPVTHITLSLMGGHTSFGATRTSWLASLVISVAGPVANILLGLAGWVAVAALQPLEAGGAFNVVLVLVELTSWANWFVGIFNLIPGLPLDGGRALEAVVWGITGREFVGTAVAAWTGRVIAVLAVAWILVSGLWRSIPLLILAGLLVWMLWAGAASSLRRARAARAMSGIRAVDLMEPAIAVPAETTLATVEAILRGAFSNPADTVAKPGPVAVLAMDGQDCVGMLNPARVTAEDPHQRAHLALGEVMDPVTGNAVIPSDLAELNLLEATARSAQPMFVVVDGHGTPVGVLRAARLNTVLREAGLLR